jgi:CcmD family protein
MKKHVRKALIALLIVYTIALFPLATPAMAQTDTSDQATTTSATSDPEANLPYLFAVYAITWVAFFAYLYYLSQRQQNLRREVEELREALAEREREG